MDASIILSIAALVTVLGGFTIQHFAFITKILQRLTRVETQSELFWGMVEGKMSDALKSPTHIKKDDLLDKFKGKSLTLPEALELKNILEDEIPKGENPVPILPYALVLGRLEQIIYDLSYEANRRNGR